MAPDTVHNGWTDWSRYVLKELERLSGGQEKMVERMGEMTTEIATLKVKAGVWGAVAGLIPAAAALIYYLIKA